MLTVQGGCFNVFHVLWIHCKYVGADKPAITSLLHARKTSKSDARVLIDDCSRSGYWHTFNCCFVLLHQY
jgi:hypothetical protein